MASATDDVSICEAIILKATFRIPDCRFKTDASFRHNPINNTRRFIKKNFCVTKRCKMSKKPSTIQVDLTIIYFNFFHNKTMWKCRKNCQRWLTSVIRKVHSLQSDTRYAWNATGSDYRCILNFCKGSPLAFSPFVPFENGGQKFEKLLIRSGFVVARQIKPTCARRIRNNVFAVFNFDNCTFWSFRIFY